MSSTIPEGHVGSLTLEQEAKLQEAWVRLGDLCGIQPPEGVDLEKLKREKGETVPDTTNDKYGQSKEFVQYIQEESPETIRKTIWSMVKMDHPDSLVLRFLRARKWDVTRAVVMLISTVRWRTEMHIEDSIVKQGEAVALKDSQTEDDKGFMLQYNSGKSYVRGLDKEGRPVYIVKPKLHNPSAQSAQAMETYILHTIESIRVLVKDPYDTACLIFDLTGFGMKNMDVHALRFIIKIFEANYPESLGVVAVHNAPWLFQGLWRMIKGWLDPVVAAKIHFTRSAADLEVFIPTEALQKEYGGKDNWEYRYVDPKPGENDKLNDTATRDAIQKEREAIVQQYEDATKEWVTLDVNTPAAKEIAAKRNELAVKLRENYWKLDPYIRARTFYDRIGILDSEGKVNFAPAT